MDNPTTVDITVDSRRSDGNQAPESTVGILDEFQTDLIAAWGQLPNKGFFFALLAAWLVLFQFLGNSILGYVHTTSLFAWMIEAYTSPNPNAESDRLGPLIPVLVLGLFWWKRKALLALSHRIWVPGLFVLVFGMVLHVAGFVLQEPRLSIIALFTGIYGLIGLTWGSRWLRNCFFPFFLFGFCIPLGDNAAFITVRLQLLVCALVETVSHNVLLIDIKRVGTQLFDPVGAYKYEVAAACSGIRSLTAVLLLSTVYGFLAFRSWWKRIVSVAMAFPLAVLGNLFRMLFIIIAAEIGGQDAGDYVHHGGPLGLLSLLPYVPAFFGVILLGRILKTESAEPTASTAPTAPSAA